MVAVNITSRQDLFNQLDQHALFRREEIDKQKLSKDSGLIKSYLLEMQAHQQPSLESINTTLRGTDWTVLPTADTSLYRVYEDGELGWLEVLSSRHIAVHTTRQSTQTDAIMRRAVNATPSLDFTWLAGTYLQTVWQELIQPRMPERYVTFRFEHQARFDAPPSSNEPDEDDEVENRDEVDTYVERRSSTLAITEQSSNIAEFLPRFQEMYPPFKCIKMLRLPATGSQGGYDFWSWGKVTHRSSEFRDGHTQIQTLMRYYETTTKAIEDKIWFHSESTHLPDGASRTSLKGSPVVFNFTPPLSDTTFDNFIETTFERGHGPMRLQGNPIRVGTRRFHVYGIDLHLWQRLYMEISPQRMLVVLPEGTCGNTIHRLATNIQRYISPSVEIHIGDITYKNLIKDVFYGKVGG